MTNLKAVILDYGEVLCQKAAEEDVQQLAGFLAIDSQTLRGLYSRDRDAYDRGDLTPDEYWRRIASYAGVPIDNTNVEQLRAADCHMWSKANPAMVEWVNRLATHGYRTGLLSNMHYDMVGYVRNNFEWIGTFDCATFSCEVRLIKPDVGIYQHCLSGLGARPEDTLFIDDRAVNIEGARRAGLHAVQFHTIEQLQADLVELGVPVLPRNGSH